MKRTIGALAFFLASSALAQQPQMPPQGGGPGGHGGPGMPAMHEDPIMASLFPPELVMQHQGEIGLTDAQRQTLSSAIQAAQSKTTDAQWKLSAEAEKLHKLLQGGTVDETQALEQVDRILALEREVKRAHMGLMVKIKNTLTSAQQEKLRQFRQQVGPKGGPPEG